MVLTATQIDANTAPVTGMSIFACFETSKILPHFTSDTQFNITGMNSTSIWELISVEWLTKVRQIIERSVDNPKSYVKFMSVLDMWHRATAGYLFFRAMGTGGIRYAELPCWLTEADALEILAVERLAAERRQIANLDAGEKAMPLRLFWFCDEHVDEWALRTGTRFQVSLTHPLT